MPELEKSISIDAWVTVSSVFLAFTSLLYDKPTKNVGHRVLHVFMGFIFFTAISILLFIMHGNDYPFDNGYYIDSFLLGKTIIVTELILFIIFLVYLFIKFKKRNYFVYRYVNRIHPGIESQDFF